MNLPSFFLNCVTQGDCCHVLRRFPAACVDFVLTDPPYLVRYQDRQGRRVPNDDNHRWMYPAFAEIHRVLRTDRYAVCFYGWGQADRFLTVWRECGLYPVGHFVFTKGYASSQGHTARHHEQAYLLVKGRPEKPAVPLVDVIPWKYAGNARHPTQKPVSILEPLIAAYSQRGDVVLDPFAGSGSTGEAARNLHRSFALIELDAGYVREAQARLFGLKPEGRSPRPQTLTTQNHSPNNGGRSGEVTHAA